MNERAGGVSASGGVWADLSVEEGGEKEREEVGRARTEGNYN